MHLYCLQTRLCYAFTVEIVLFKFMLTVLVDCSNSSPSSSYKYTIPNPATLGSTMLVSCAMGYQWAYVSTNSSLNATCTNITGGAKWIVNGGDSCRGTTSTHFYRGAYCNYEYSLYSSIRKKLFSLRPRI